MTGVSPAPAPVAPQPGKEAPGAGAGTGSAQEGRAGHGTAGVTGAMEGGLPFGSRKTQTQTGAEGWGPSLAGMPALGWEGPGGTLRNVLSESH